ncbi:DUF4350 domain-containing protein [Paenibacillus sp. NEAU-GSW1]|uniref:DUF4350 domain-containing protein n=1 Tax=Paenibacillus sp. NEAU-GSW1 TaxID=2682486 RepID=UPI0012E0E496|nr:DUF4350 domain-containing protein [Paenibacillus sp. NEAU-GSW1]MUT64630.1 DUF4350 domain-containing protein [Paenibacillus sp. NEAU-GSW1]
MRNENRQRIGLALCVIAFILVGLILVQPEAKTAPPPYASGSARPDGVKGLYTWMKEEGAPVKGWKKEWRFLPKSEGYALIVIEPDSIEDYESEEIQSWVEVGNDLLLLSSSPYLWDWFEVGQLDDRTASDEAAVPIRVPAESEAEEGTFTGVIDTEYRLQLTPAMEPLLEDSQGIIAGRLQQGEGSITLLLAPEWARNDQILDESHFELLAPLLQTEARAILFDDYHHGVTERPGIAAVYPAWLLAGALQLGIGLLLWLWLKAVRFGPAYTPRAWTVRRGDETVLAAAGWYERRRLAREAIHHQSRYIRSMLREKWKLPIEASDRQTFAAAKLRWKDEDAERLVSLLQSLSEAERASVYSMKQLVKDSRNADDMIRKLENE